MSFGERLGSAVAEFGPLCAGIDPHPGQLDDWGLPRSAAGARDFGLRLVEALSGTVGVLKPQSAFFEEYGSAGIAALEDVLAAARAAGILTVLDAKRGDIGSTMAGYARAYLGEGPLAADALTVSPFLGFGALGPALELARENGRGLFVLALTSNKEGASVQHASLAGRSVAADLVAQVAAANAQDAPGRLGDVGLVVGATIGSAARDLGIDLAEVGGPILSPGFGAQGATRADLDDVFGTAMTRGCVLVNSSRQIAAAGPAAEGLRAAARRVLDEIGTIAG